MTQKEVPPSSSDTVVAMAAAILNPVYTVDLPVGCGKLGFEVQGSPLVISMIDGKECPVAEQLTMGHYIHGVIMPDIQIVYIMDPTHLMNLLAANVNNPRRLIVSNAAFYVDPSLPATGTPYVLYKNKLPAVPDLGVVMKGFPPFIVSVESHSKLVGRLHPNQTVECLLIPGQPTMNLQSGAFTASNLYKKLNETAHIEGRELVVKDAPPGKQSKGEDTACDDCVIL